ncbi:membrane protein [Paenibacillus swuensis]|uniref:Membrane protein n=1 Tax=Paenibacillus swuensis TaxID=1178515 RepID=A0A172TH94_9BACL|nr:DMT family transporter [Paenibacillus swuensis]ANE46342.1 membrane protein [Paenibacillus swuensis]
MKRTWLADLSLLLVALVWGTTFVIVQNAIQTLPPFSFNAIRFAMAALMLLVMMLVFFRSQLTAFRVGMLLPGVFLGFMLFCGYAFQTAGLLYTTSANTGFITGLSVVLVPLFAVFLLKEQLRIPSILGAAAAAGGLYFLTLGETFAVNFGDVLVLLCAVAFALHIVYTGKFAPSYPPLLLALMQIATVAVLSSFGALLLEPRTALSTEVLLQPDVMWALLITSLFATAIAFVVQTACQRFTTPARVAIIFAMEPVFAALTAVLWAGEQLGPKALFGCLLIFGGMLLSELQPNVRALSTKSKSR